MDIKSLHYYVTVCEQGKMSQAAQKLFISKQALSSIIQKIEEETGAVLLVRTRSGVEMTEEGRCLYDYSLKILALWRQAEAQIGELQANRKTQLRIGFGYLSYNLWSQAAEEAFLAGNPHVELQIITDASNKLIERLHAKQIDMIITGVATDTLRESYCCEQIACGDKRLWMAAEDQLASFERVHPLQMKDRVVYCFEADRAYMMHFAAYMEKNGVSFEPRFMPSGNILASLRLLQRENALLMLSEMLCAPLEPIRGLVSRELVDSAGMHAPQGILSAVMQKEIAALPAARRFVSFLRETVSEGMERQRRTDKRL